MGQIGGRSAYQALNLTTNPRAAALGGTSLSLADGDVSQFFENPAALDSTKSGDAFFHINPYFADVSIYSIAYAFDVKDVKGFAAGVSYVNFGSFEMKDETGTSLGTFSANDYVFTVGKAHRLGPFALGINLKLANTRIDTYSSSAFLADVGGTFTLSKNWKIAMVMENMGIRLTEFSAFESPAIPFDVRLGTSFKPQYMPIRFTVTTNNLVDENELLGSETTGRANNGIDKVWKRINLGAELLLSDNFQLLFGYNHKRKQELSLTDLGAGVGFSYGLMVRVKRVEIRFSRATYHSAGGGSSFISLQTNMKDFKKIL